ncbi:MAG: hypothetical protein GX141_05250 [Armatimonadetes bacterium]|nr:hypothetical protein [Armatimonadota bacterium]
MNHYHFDQLGSTRLLTNSAGAVTDEYSYDAYGAVLSHNRSTGSIDQPYQYVGQLGYYTHYREPNFGLPQLGVRFYDSEVGRFGQAGPAQNGINWYEYVACKPVVSTDPSGLQIESPGYPYAKLLKRPKPVKIEWHPIACINAAMREADNIRVKDDKLAHCFAACRAMRCLNYTCNPLALDIVGRLIEKYWSNDDEGDANSQTIGIAVAYTGHSCREGCSAALRLLRRNNRGRYRND